MGIVHASSARKTDEQRIIDAMRIVTFSRIGPVTHTMKIEAGSAGSDYRAASWQNKMEMDRNDLSIDD